MNMIASWIQSAVDEHSLNVVELSSETAAKWFLEVTQKFGETDIERPLWETLRVRASKRRSNGWQDIGQFVGETKCILMIEEGPKAYECENGKTLTNLLEECPGFEFYVTNCESKYLLCHNHHNYLIGCGSAVDWVQSLSDNF
jgi:hypothetical protein